MEELLAEFERLRKQKAELEEQEQALVAKLRERLKDQTYRLQKLGVVPAPAAPLAPAAKGFEVIAPPHPRKQ